MLFRPEKWSSYKVEKNRHFAKGLVHGFSQQIEIFFISFFLSQESQKKTFFDILDRKECFLEHQRKVLKNSKKVGFCKGVSPFFCCQKIDLFSDMFFFSKKRQKETFFNILDRKECFSDLKSEILKRSKKSTFCKGVSPWFFSNSRPFPYLFFWAKKARKILFLISWIVKNAF